jgi:pimeloyl-[acyl-carrier protein] methyl ester esterase
VLLPGLDGTGILFRPLLAALPESIQAKVIAYPDKQNLSLSEHARWVIRQLPGEKVVLLAESFSGLVALMLLTEAAARIREVIFVGAFAEPPRPLLLKLPLVSRSASLARSVPSFLLRRYCLGKDATVTQLNLLREALAAVKPEIVAHRLALAGARHSFGKTPFTVPCHYLQATEDRLVPEACAGWFRQRFEKFQLERLAGPHFLLQMRPRECAQAIVRIIQSSA